MSDRDGQHLRIPAGDCEGCLHGPALHCVTPARWGTRNIGAVQCPVHGRTVTIATEDGTRSVTIRSGDSPSPTVTAWIDTVTSVGHPGHRLRIPTEGGLDAWWHGEHGDYLADEMPQDLRATAAIFSLHEISRAGMEYLLDLGLSDVTLARRWYRSGLRLDDTPDCGGEWVRGGFAVPEHAVAFMHLGLSPQSAAAFGGTPSQWEFLIVADLPKTLDWAGLVDRVSPAFAKAGHQMGRSPEEVVALGSALSRAAPDPLPDTPERFRFSDHHLYSVWSRAHSAALTRQAKRAIALNQRPLSWLDLAACVDAGMSLDEALQFVADGGDMDPVRLVAALHH